MSGGRPAGGAGQSTQQTAQPGYAAGSGTAGSFSSQIPSAGTYAAAAAAGLAGSSAPAAPETPDTGGGKPTDCGTVTMTADVVQGRADIVWIIDGSGSMNDERAAVQQNIASFAGTIGAAGIDHHVVMVADSDVAAGTPLGNDAGHYLYVNAEVGSRNALQRLVEQYPTYSAFLRPDATLHFVVVTDDESRLSASEFQTQMEQLAGKKFVFHAIASEDVNGAACQGTCGIPLFCGAANPGREYYALANATGGQKVSICIADWSMVFGPLQQAVIESAPLPCDYTLPAPPTGGSLDPSKVNVDYSAPASAKITLPRADNEAACGSELAWYYDDPVAPKAVRMCPSACTVIKGGGTVDIQLGCATVLLF